MILSKIVRKHAMDPQIILKWSLDIFRIFENHLGFVWRNKKNINKKNCQKFVRSCLQNTPKDNFFFFFLVFLYKILHNQTMLVASNGFGPFT